MHLYIIRHAQSTNNEIYARTNGSEGRLADPPLTELGHRQAQLLARFLTEPPRVIDATKLVWEYAARHDRRGFDLTHLYCSLMIRAVQTGSYIAEATGLPLVAWPEVHERGGLHIIDEVTGKDIGQPGPNRAQFNQEYPHLVLPETLGEKGWWDRPPETIEESYPRAHQVWTQLMERHGGTDDRVAIVTHGGFFQSLIGVLLSDGDPPQVPGLSATGVWFGISNTSINRFRITDKRVDLYYLNNVEFLPDEFVTG